MKDILLLEDDREARYALIQIIKELESEIGEEIIVHAFAKEEEAYACISMTQIDLFLVDIVLHPEDALDASGVLFVQKIRNIKQYQYTPVLLVSGVAQPSQKVYAHLHCYGYLEKPFSKHHVKKVIQDALQMPLKKTDDDYYYIKNEGIIYVIRLSQFVFARSVNRHLEVVKADGKVILLKYMTLKKLYGILAGEDIMQCSRNAIVNRAYIDYIDTVRQIICLTGGRGELSIGITYKKLLKRIKYE